MIKQLIFSTTILGIALPTLANDDFLAWMNQEKSSYNQYIEKQDREFSSFLKQKWKEVDVSEAKVVDAKPKPIKLPDIEPTPLKNVPKQPIVRIEPVAPKVLPNTSPETPISKPTSIIAPTVPVVSTPKSIEIISPKIAGPHIKLDFFGSALVFTYDQGIQKEQTGRINNKSISTHWETLSSSDFKPLVKQLQNTAEQLQLSDWSYALLIDKLTAKLIPNDANTQTLASWFLLIKSGYKARVAYNNHQLFLLMPTQQPLYGITYFTFDKQRYYAVSLNNTPMNVGKVFTYNGSYPNATKSFDLALQHYPASKEINDKKLNFSYNNKSYAIDVKYQPQVVKYLNTYPQIDIKYYFDAPLADITRQSLIAELTPLVQGKSEIEAANLLLRFVQKAFPYKTDEEQFSKENYLFPVETIFYPYSDCEDRSVLFAWLTKTLLGLDVVGLRYPGHIATAVALSTRISGDSVSFNNKRYVISDLTYINSNVGMSMPDFKGVKPTFITIGG
jgi:hypothetical protein